MRDRGRPFDAVRGELNDISPKINQSRVRLDLRRQQRTGVPEIVLGAGKLPSEVASSLAALVEANGRAIASRCSDETAALVRETLGGRFDVIVDGEARIVVVSRRDALVPVLGGRVGILTAGSSDGPIAAEAAIVATEMGGKVSQVRDVGVAGLHRLVGPLEELIADGVDVLVVVAGMDGALPSVVAGLVDVPVIGLPTSTGYGYGGGGVGALMAMLQTCVPGLVVVNIDNGVGAGAAAALIANRAAARRPEERAAQDQIGH